MSIRLLGNAVISGRIAGVNGQPLLGVEVSALRKIYDATGVSLLPERMAVRTDDRGEYRLAGLTPNRYYIHASTARLPYALTGSDRFGGDSPAPDRSPGRYVAAFYPGVADRDRASALDMQGGSERKNVDIGLARSPLYRIRGRISNPLGIRTSGSGSFTVVPVKTDAVSLPDMSTVPIDADGEFTLANVVPGDYWVSVSTVTTGTPPGDRDSGRGYARAKVIDGDVDDVEITLHRTITIAGAIQIEEGSADVRAAQVDLRMNFSPGITGPPHGPVEVQPDGSFAFTGLPLLEYEVAINALPAGMYVKSARFGDADALTQAIQSNAYPTPRLSLVLARGVDVTGRVTDSEGKPVSKQQVVLVPDRISNRIDLYKTATTDSDGRFNVSGVAPGDYQAFAWRTLEPFRYFDPDFVKSFEPQVTSLHVDIATPAAIDVKLISWEQFLRLPERDKL